MSLPEDATEAAPRPAVSRLVWIIPGVAVAAVVAAIALALHDAGSPRTESGAVQLSPELKPNQPHRADAQKLLVDRRGRNRGVAQALMKALEETAKARGRTLLCLDTATGSPAERLYEKLGWQRLGVIPRHAMWPHGGLCDTTFFWKDLTML